MNHPDTSEKLRCLADLVEQAMCIGCGLCQGLAGGAIRMARAKSGYLLPEVTGPPAEGDIDAILACCPSRQVRAPQPEEGARQNHDPVWGAYRRLVHGWAGDAELRFEGASGGVLSALGAFVLASGKVDFVLHARAARDAPAGGEAALSFSRTDILAGAGSRYGPTAILAGIKEVLDLGRPFAVIGKPCDLTALRNFARFDARVDRLVKYWLSLVCGGFMPPEGTNAFLARYGIAPEEVRRLRYRGRGFPGPTRVETWDGRVVEASYYDFWGENYDRWTLPHRCKICPDSIGEAADIVAADPWPGGGPDPEDAHAAGSNVMIVRTGAGEGLVAAAAADGALVLGDESDIDQMNDYQPHQVARKHTAWARLEGLRAEGRLVPETAGLRIEELARRMDEAFNAAQEAGMRARVRAGKASEPRPDWG